MENIIRINKKQILEITSVRNGETKLGEVFDTIPDDVEIDKYLENSKSKYVVLGIPEDVGVRANFGRQGTYSAWENALKNLVNVQSNEYLNGSEILILGTVDVSEQMEKSKNLNPNNIKDLEQLRSVVSEIDNIYFPIIKTIVSNGKIPIVIGGGHNNSYGNIKGSSLAHQKKINVINFDAHTDFRILEGRHSGNGFSYSFNEGFLEKYFIFGLHESYNSENILNEIKSNSSRIRFNTYEQIAVRNEKLFEEELQRASDFISTDTFGIELDLDSLAFVPSSAMTPSGFSIEFMRRYLSFFASSKNVSYLHICESAPALGDDKNPNLVGKLISYLIADFVKANQKN